MSNMTRIKIILWTALFTALLVSCSNPSGNSGGNPVLIPNDNLPPLEKNEFYAQNIKTGKYYKVKADILYSTSKCVIWAERGSGVTQEEAKKIADEYDNSIRPKVVDAFSKKKFNFTYGGSTYHFNDMLDFADWLVDEDKKLTILLLDIKDGYNPPMIKSYVAGYFFSGNFYSKGKIQGSDGSVHYSNGRDMIYVDTNPGLKSKPEQAYTTFAHELQHLINFVTSVQMNRAHLMDTWIDEGLSSQAEYLYLGENPEVRYKWFNDDSEGTIAKGNNFFVWDNHPEPDAILDEYATVYLFFRWLSLRAKTVVPQPQIFLDIEDSSFYDYQAVTNAAKNIDSKWSSWETLLRTWFAANYSPTNNIYGYTGDPVLQTIKVKSIAEPTISLYPGEGVYSKMKSDGTAGSFSPTIPSGTNIRYVGLTDTTTTPDITSPYDGKMLLTFNANTKNTGSRETGYLTGVPVSPSISQTMARSIQTETITGPYVIDARDMLERYKR